MTRHNSSQSPRPKPAAWPTTGSATAGSAGTVGELTVIPNALFGRPPADITVAEVRQLAELLGHYLPCVSEGFNVHVRDDVLRFALRRNQPVVYCSSCKRPYTWASLAACPGESDDSYVP